MEAVERLTVSSAAPVTYTALPDTETRTELSRGQQAGRCDSSLQELRVCGVITESCLHFAVRCQKCISNKYKRVWSKGAQCGLKWEADAAIIAHDVGLYGHTSGGLKAACALEVLARRLGSAQSFRRVLRCTEPESSPGATANQSGSARSGTIYGRLSVFSCDSRMLSLVHQARSPVTLQLNIAFPGFQISCFPRRMSVPGM